VRREIGILPSAQSPFGVEIISLGFEEVKTVHLLTDLELEIMNVEIMNMLKVILI
jgi:hypothetical protein